MLILKPHSIDQSVAGAKIPAVTFIAHIGLTPTYSRPCQTPWSVFLDGSVVPVTSDGAPREVDTGSPKAYRTVIPPAERRLTRTVEVHRFRLSRLHDTGHNRVSPCRFQALFNSLFKVLCIFPSRYLFAIGLSPVFSFRWNLPPNSSCNPKQPDSAKTHRAAAIRHGTGLSPSPIPCSKGFERRTRPMAPF